MGYKREKLENFLHVVLLKLLIGYLLGGKW